MFLLRPSSIRILGPAHAEPTGTEEQLIPAAIETPTGPDLGSSIPDSYDIDFLRVLVQDPFSLYIYWELRQSTVEALTKVFPKEEIPEFQIVLRLIEMTERHESFFNVGRIGSYWMSVFAGKKYRFEIGVRSPRRGYIKLIGSNEADTPRGTIAPESDRIPRFRVNRNSFINILDASGFRGSEALVTETEEDSQRYQGIHQALGQLPQNIQTTIRRAATGSGITADEIDQLPIALREALMRIRSQSGGKFASMALVHYLPELLRWLAAGRTEPDEGFLTPIPSAPRFMLGSSEMRPAPVSLDRVSSINRPSSPPVGTRWNKPEDKS